MDSVMQDVPGAPTGHQSERAARYHRSKARMAEEASREQQASSPAQTTKRKKKGKKKGKPKEHDSSLTARERGQQYWRKRQKRERKQSAKHAAIVASCLDEIRRQPDYHPTVQVGVPVEPGNEANFLAGTRITVDLPPAGNSFEPRFEPAPMPVRGETYATMPTSKHIRFPDEPASDSREFRGNLEPGYGVLVRRVPLAVPLEDVQRAFSEFGPVVELEVNEMRWSTATKEVVIQYSDYASVAGAVQNMNGVVSGNHVLEVLPLGRSDP